MKNLLFAVVIGSALLAAGLLAAGDFGSPRVIATQASAPVQQASATDRTVTLQVDGMFCPSCPYIVKKTLAAVPGVKDVSVSYKNKTAVVTFDGVRTNVAALTDATFEMGYPSEIRRQ
jgi:periplasmic mercuric ion binding protein